MKSSMALPFITSCPKDFKSSVFEIEGHDFTFPFWALISNDAWNIGVIKYRTFGPIDVIINIANIAFNTF